MSNIDINVEPPDDQHAECPPGQDEGPPGKDHLQQQEQLSPGGPKSSVSILGHWIFLLSIRTTIISTPLNQFLSSLVS